MTTLGHLNLRAADGTTATADELIAFERVLHAVRGLTPDGRRDVLKRAGSYV